MRLVDEAGKAFRADDIEEDTFYTAYPEHADRERIGAPVVVVRLKPARLRLPGKRRGWAPMGIVAYSKICTHAGCAIALYRKPTFPEVQPRPALICPCHYSTFDPADGGVEARILWLLEALGPKATRERGGSGIISCNNNDGAAETAYVGYQWIHGAAERIAAAAREVGAVRLADWMSSLPEPAVVPVWTAWIACCSVELI